MTERQPYVNVPMSGALKASVRMRAEERGMSSPVFCRKLIEEGMERLLPPDEFRLTYTGPLETPGE